MIEVGREIAILLVAEESAATKGAVPSPMPPSMQELQQPPRPSAPPEVHPSPAIAPALPAAITRRLVGVVPANVQLAASWRSVRTARETAKQRKLDYSPSLMLAWCTTRAMERHAAFRRLVQKDGGIIEQQPFDLGIAVALDSDALATAVIRAVSRLDWAAFATAYSQAVADVRAGKIVDVQAPVNLTSLGAFGVEQAIPIVVPPAMGTLFIGKAHERMINDGGQVYPTEMVTLSLTFDHRIVNGAGAAAFLRDVKQQIETFALPG